MRRKRKSKRSRPLAGARPWGRPRQNANTPVPKTKAVHQSGAKKGKLKKGCRYRKGGRTVCSPEVARRLTGRSGSSSSRKTSSSSSSRSKAKHCYSPNSSLPFKKGKGGRRVLRKGCRRNPSTGKICCARKMTRRKRAA